MASKSSDGRRGSEGRCPCDDDPEPNPLTDVDVLVVIWEAEGAWWSKELSTFEKGVDGLIVLFSFKT